MANRAIRHQLVCALGILTAAGWFTGCVAAHDKVSREELPPAWTTALQYPEKIIPNISGRYQDLGDYLHEFAHDPAHTPPARLAHLLFTDIKPPVAAQLVGFLQGGSNHLEIFAMQDGRVVASKSVTITTDPGTGAVILPPERGFDTSGNMAAAAEHSTAVVLYKGKDGALYVQVKSFTDGVVAAVVPMAVSTENWGRWIPAR
jgi:hypothetical protein